MEDDVRFIQYLKTRENVSFVGASDEVGRGPLAGPVVSVTVVAEFISREGIDELDCYLEEIRSLGVTDSKKLSTKKRANILNSINIVPKDLQKSINYILLDGKNFKIHFSIAEISAAKIDEINILNASLKAMTDSFESVLANIKGDVGEWFIDGNKIPPYPDTCKRIDANFVIKGDSKLGLIALASIIAKEYRDHLMVKMGALYPGYGLEKHAGYPTKRHKEKLLTSGITPIHRKTFKGVKECIHIVSGESS